jgi:16S rRNA C967 or C1407 C5-methylase (RsmB/RsmF family)
MRHLLGHEAEAFFAAFAQPSPTGLRLNPLRGEPAALAASLPWSLEPVPWCDTGRVIVDPDVPAKTSDTPERTSSAPGSGADAPRPGPHPYHQAGVYYLQDPAAMAVAEVVSPLPGERVLDLAAAPGGKSTHLAGKMAGGGLLVANDVHPERARALLGNLERLGVANAMVTQDRPERLARAWPGWFDRVLLDAPCSGEGMFRKNPDAARHWSEEHVLGCARRQDALLDAAAELVRPGGTLTYATCTFAPEENEGAVVRFLERHPEFALTPIRLVGLQPGRPDWVDPADPRMTMTARIWAHHGVGEGHFVASLRRADPEGPVPAAEAEGPARSAQALPRIPRGDLDAARRAWEAVTAEVLAPGWHGVWQPSGVHGGRLLAYPHGLPPLQGVRVVRAGLHLATVPPAARARDLPNAGRRAHGGSVRGRPRSGAGRTDDAGSAGLEPAHALAMALPDDAVAQRLSLAPDDPRVDAYLAGAHLRFDERELASPGDPARFVRVEVDGFPLGWGRRIAAAGDGRGAAGSPPHGGSLRSLLPKGLRRSG